ncbi:MAG TPA: CoA-acylating methylmalonate-semialdehyde dehydrogenase [Vicinamibacterales bacterium]|jgi:malonate-semialdehyde dehydrogenase (acetylating)/methylmalonate-semialdehyde dehydrogenase|nr:CoA-acylating methylmalonate-semialdehyde dehydrogenase [Vicinamibacterales bacterium]
MPTIHIETLGNYVAGRWQTPDAPTQDVVNPATGEPLARVPLSPAREVDATVAAAARAFEGWRRTPATERIQYLFKLKNLLEENLESIARTITIECGKTIGEARAEMRRGVENVETACGIPILSQGYTSEDIAAGIDEIMIRQPLGVVAAITPFNFPGMIPLWFLPYAIACGNCFICKPSERVPLTMQKIMGVIERVGLPPGVVSLVNGGKEAVDALLDHPEVRAISFVGSSPVAKYIYQRAAANGKRVQCQGGAKNPIVIMPDADMDMTVRMAADSAFGCAGQRCLAASVVIPIGEARETFTPRMLDAAQSRRVGNGLDEATEMGPVITAESRRRIEGLIEKGVGEGGKVLVDGRSAKVQGHEGGYFLKPTVIETSDPGGTIGTTEIFGPVIALSEMRTLDDAIAAVNRSAFGNMACIFTSSGATARKFRYEARAGNIGVNIGVAAPMAFFPFSGWKGSFFGDLHAQGHDAIEFFMDKKVVVERWPKEWTRTF